eukprot:SAG11_NODE_4520_length_1865_cov_5.099660_2_plen_164_part_00
MNENYASGKLSSPPTFPTEPDGPPPPPTMLVVPDYDVGLNIESEFGGALASGGRSLQTGPFHGSGYSSELLSSAEAGSQPGVGKMFRCQQHHVKDVSTDLAVEIGPHSVIIYDANFVCEPLDVLVYQTIRSWTSDIPGRMGSPRTAVHIPRTTYERSTMIPQI